jgi:hypothetical protein
MECIDASFFAMRLCIQWTDTQRDFCYRQACPDMPTTLLQMECIESNSIQKSNIDVQQILTPIELYRCGSQRKLSKWKYYKRKLIVPITKYWIQRMQILTHKSRNDNLKLPKIFIHVSLRKQCILAAKSTIYGLFFCLEEQIVTVEYGIHFILQMGYQLCDTIAPILWEWTRKRTQTRSWFHSRITWSTKISNSLSANNLFGEM